MLSRIGNSRSRSSPARKSRVLWPGPNETSPRRAKLARPTAPISSCVTRGAPLLRLRRKFDMRLEDGAPGSRIRVPRSPTRAHRGCPEHRTSLSATYHVSSPSGLGTSRKTTAASACRCSGLASVTDQIFRACSRTNWSTALFVRQKTLGRLHPTWLNEGLAQWFEGRRSNRTAAGLAAAFDKGQYIPLQRLEGSWGLNGRPDR